VTAADPSWPAFWSHWIALPFWPSGPMWFLWFLLVLNVVAAGMYWLAPRWGELLARLPTKRAARSGRFFIMFVGVSALAYVPLAAVFTPWEWVNFGPFGFQPALAPQYVLYFFAGLSVGAHGLDRGLLAPNGVLARRWGFWLAGMAASFLLWLIATGLIVKGGGASIPGLQIAADLGFVLFAATACFGLAATFLRFAAARWPIFDSISENAYGIYFFHYIFVIWTQYALLGVSLPAIIKGMIAFMATLGLSWAATAALCLVPIGARLMRGKRRELARST
jgi:hypothetical protein